jgi:hypothetical protein
MTAAPRRQLPGVIALALGVVALFLLVIPAGAVRSELGGRRWVSWAMLLLLAGLGWGAATVPIVWTDVFALPAVLEKLMFVAALGGIALLCTRLQPRLLAALSPEATDRPLEALADRWSRSARPRLARYVGRGELR